jgi:hypothetical protein
MTSENGNRNGNENRHNITRNSNDIHQSTPEKITLQLLEAPLGNHYLVIYPNLETVRKIYTDYIKFQIEHNNTTILFLPYYDTTDRVREILMNNGVDVRRLERAGSLTLLDFTKIIDNPYLGIPAAFGLRQFLIKIQGRISEKIFIVIAEMSVYYILHKIHDLFEFESQSHNDHQFRRWKQLCLYHKSDFNLMFTEIQKREILEHHKKRTFLLD